ncbi:Retrovirus-related Pol polyprotein from transposon RE1 [Vitis vinifera]|uniref:Retrovirus-related Pol polyprotein from transposon RE1 n=1 Tax=Vitis vinifera TaxID=29760 RepID=A0A438K9H5_VITVI|nr:Retrovirus-related Pol polyprotein from transposon RE1 [Vitis vinifera]
MHLLGYSRLQKGYRCYSSETHCYFLSAYVTFFEDSPFFSTSESLPVFEVLPLPIISPPDVPADSLPIPSASPAPALPPSADLPIALRKVGCRWVYTVKVGPDGQIASVRLLLSMAAMRSWPLYQLDIKNAFLHGDLAEEVYMEQPPGFVAQGSLEFDMFRSTADHSVFYHHNSSVQCIYLTKDLGKLKYFLGIEIAQSSSGVVLSQRKYALDILEETGMLDCKPVDTPMDPNVKLIPGQGEPLGDHGRYRRLVGKLNYLTITRLDISFPVSVVSQFLQSPCDSHWDVVIRILRYIKSTPGQGVLYENRGHTQVVGYTDADWAGSPTDRRSTSGYCVFIGGNLISWKNKKQDVVARSSAETEYRAMALATCELIWLKHLIRELRFGKDEQMKLICDNKPLCILHLIQSSMKGPNTLKLTVTSLERRSHQDDSEAAAAFKDGNRISLVVEKGSEDELSSNRREGRGGGEGGGKPSDKPCPLKLYI